MAAEYQAGGCTGLSLVRDCGPAGLPWPSSGGSGDEVMGAGTKIGAVSTAGAEGGAALLAGLGEIGPTSTGVTTPRDWMRISGGGKIFGGFARLGLMAAAGTLTKRLQPCLTADRQHENTVLNQL